MHLNKKVIFPIIAFLAIVGILAAIVFLGDFVKPTEQYLEQIHIECRVSDIADTNYMDSVLSYTMDQERFYRCDDSQNGNLLETPYYIDDYIPYKITVSIRNDSEIHFSGKHLVGIYSNECVFTEISNISYWTGSISPYTEKNYDMIIWFNKDLSKEQISQHISMLNCSYQMLGDFSYFKHSMAERTLVIPCEFAWAENSVGDD